MVDDMGHTAYTEQDIIEVQQVLLETPIDPAYDDICNSFYDGWDRGVHRQMYVRDCYNILKELGRLPPETKCTKR